MAPSAVLHQAGLLGSWYLSCGQAVLKCCSVWAIWFSAHASSTWAPVGWNWGSQFSKCGWMPQGSDCAWGEVDRLLSEGEPKSLGALPKFPECISPLGFCSGLGWCHWVTPELFSKYHEAWCSLQKKMVHCCWWAVAITEPLGSPVAASGLACPNAEGACSVHQAQNNEMR